MAVGGQYHDIEYDSYATQVVLDCDRWNPGVYLFPLPTDPPRPRPRSMQHSV